MPTAFTQRPSSPIAFGAGRVEKLPKDVSRLAGDGAGVLLISDPGVVAAGIAGRVQGVLEAGGLSVTLFDDVQSDPKAASIDAASAAAREARAGCVIGLGGGSALDVAKMAANIAKAGNGAEHYALAATRLERDQLPKILIPTTAGTGSEVTRTSVFTSADGRKLWAWGEELRADLALLDPTLTTGLPAGLTAATGVDALVHAIEGCTTNRAQAIADAQCLHAIRLIVENLPRAVAAPDDLEARGNMLIAACLAGIGFDTTSTGIGHALGHALGALAGVHHGRAVGLALRAALPYNAEAAPKSHAAVARAMGMTSDGKADEELSAALPAHFDAFLRRVGLNISLDDAGLGADGAKRLAELAMAPENAAMRQSNIREITADLAEEIAREMLSAG